MKPLILEISAFGPYSERQAIDFAELKGRNFFLIHGATGAGKTTLLDAMCYALYGSATSDLREVKGLRSDFADPSNPTEVAFTFSIGLQTYKVRRSPRQERKKKRGDGVTEQLPEAELWEIKGKQAHLIEAKYENVTRKVIDLLGFQCSQFRQVVLLPQGEFRKLLIAKSDERQQILKTLFKTEIYQQIEDHLRQKARMQTMELRELEERRKWLLAESGAASGEALTETCERLQKLYQEAESQLKTVHEAYETAQQAATEGQLIVQKFNEAKAATEALKQLQAQLPAFEEKRVLCRRLQKAAALYEAEKTVRQWQAERNDSEKQQTEQKKVNDQQQEKLQMAAQRLTTELSREEERKNAEEKVHKLKEYALREAALLEAEKEVDKCRLFQKEQSAVKKSIDEKLRVLQADIEKKALQLQNLLEGAAREQAFLLERQAMEERINKRRRFTALELEEQQQRRCLENIVSARKAAEREKESCELTVKRTQALFLMGQAAHLARSLQADAPCPVCGSLQHPKPAVSAEAMPREEELQALEDKATGIQKQYTALQEKELRAMAVYEAAKKIKKQLEFDLGTDILQPLEVLEKQAAALEEKYQLACAEGKEAKLLGERLELLRAAAIRGQEKQQEAQTNLQSAENAVEAALAIARERSEELPDCYRNIEVLQHEIAAASKKQKELQTLLEEARQQAAKQAAAAAAAAAALDQMEKRFQRAQKEFTKEREAFYKRLREEGFREFKEYAEARHQVGRLAALENECAKFDQNFAAAVQRNEMAQSSIEGKPVPDIEALLKRVTDLGQQQSALIAGLAKYQAELEKSQLQKKEILRLEATLKEKEQKSCVLAGLYQVTRGDNPYEMNFQRFVLGALLDQVTAAASVLLRNMSRSRYHLQRTIDVARKGSASGLDLYVFDNYSGIARPAATLSGGETFLASLSLALGLADVVQQYAGGIRLDTILIDEGFGTLDPESLDMAIQTLMDLQAGGRLVGIISHVPELKERIDARLEVTGSKRGSRVQIHVG